ncbi:hypothetical protein BFP70_19210 [Thioclava sp. SK-1]|uniref:serine/threonine-protein kinase n=1 Tax=Thioclava sp. SK-1 TaxID=1889770 RepID=UPI0008271E59|nr:serine/threonine-protein kinase [Thioclava sp. SK-1]OCX58186.1 hypothetical protein BFP70_19210 [Thioclava sp. SK-1]
MTPPDPLPENRANKDNDQSRTVIDTVGMDAPVPAAGPPPAPGPETDKTVFTPVTDAADGTDEHASSQKPPVPVDAALPALAQPRTASVAAHTSPSTTAIAIGTLINNNYEITQTLKAGGMGAVYRGVEIGTGDPVAIKAILPELAEDEKVGLMFKREARTLRQLADEAIVRYYNYVHDRELDRYFLVMEFIEGVPLSEHIEQSGAIPVPQAQILLRRLAKGLAKAHAQDVIHRDLSPDNVMLPDDAVDQARLIDFGIAKSNVLQESTMAGQFAGKFKYVAPEQLGHYNGDVTPATDIYGLALMICATVIGRPLNMGSSIVEAVQSRLTIPDLQAVPEAMRPLLAHMLEPDPARRPASMDVVQQMLATPAMIPMHYRMGLPMPPALQPAGNGTVTGREASALTHSAPGLQLPGAACHANPSAPPMPVALPMQDGARDGAGRLLGALAMVFAASIAAAGWYAWDHGLLGNDPPLPMPVASAGQGGGSANGTAPVTTTRDGFLAAFDTGECTYTARIAAGPNAGMIEGFSASGEAFAGLPAAYEEAFGARPAILSRQITSPQCSALDFAHKLQGRGRPGVQMVLSEDQITSGESVGAQLQAEGAQSLWLVLITPVGGVYNLTDRLSDPVGGQRRLNFGLNLAQGEEEQPQILLAVASDTPLVRAAAARDGTQAADLLPQILDEIAQSDGAAAAAVSYVMLRPAAAAETQGTAAQDD